MPDIINLLSDAVANQIAAGEVIQRPASVVKELLENAIDAGAGTIKVILREAGKNMIQVVDDGCGMSDTDARMAFERHATSKIKNTSDLFEIKTMGFRGEALASVAAIADVELKTRLHDEELGTRIHISSSEVHAQEPVQCPPGSNFMIKNLFFNVPARRKFLKSNSTELKHVINEFQRVALAHPELALSLSHNRSEIFNLPADNIKKRIISLFGKTLDQHLIPLNSKTNLLEIQGFICSPDAAKKTFGDQYFFVNNRYMRHAYFHKAVLKAYEKVLPADYHPVYFIFFEIASNKIDINIHPTKTEVKFEDERAIWHIVEATVKQALGKHNVVPSLDFENEGLVDMPVFDKNREVRPPEIKVDPEYNPFQASAGGYRKTKVDPDWEKVYGPLQDKKIPQEFPDPDHGFEGSGLEIEQKPHNPRNFLQVKNKYILTPVKSGIMLIDQKRAHERILFEKYLDSLRNDYGISQQDLFPKNIDLLPGDFEIMMEIIEDLCKLGFDIRTFGRNSLVINGYPSDAGDNDPGEVIHQLLSEYKETRQDIKVQAREKVALSLAKASAIDYGKKMMPEEMQELVDKLFACQVPNISPSGLPSLTILDLEELEKKLD